MRWTEGFARWTGVARALVLVAPLLAGVACNGAATLSGPGPTGGAGAPAGQSIAAPGTPPGNPSGNPQFDDPAKAAIVQRFERDYRRFGRAPDRVAAGASAETCPIDDPKRAFRWITGRGLSWTEASMSSSEKSYAVDLNSIRIRMVSGSCDMLRAGGDVSFVADVRAVWRLGGAGGQYTFLNLRDSVYRVTGTMRDGKRVGPFRTIESLVTTRIDRNEAGEFEVTGGAGDHANRAAKAPKAFYTYETYQPTPDRALRLSFSRHPESNRFTTAVDEPLGEGIVRTTTYDGADLTTQSSTKDGVMHGWFINHYTEPPSRTCYRNGVEIRATTCPMS